VIVTERILDFFHNFVSQLKVLHSSDHHAQTVFKLVTPLEHTRTIHIFIAICNFYLIINLNLSFSLSNEITDDTASFALGGRLD
jgi:hypothetical protein